MRLMMRSVIANCGCRSAPKSTVVRLGRTAPHSNHRSSLLSPYSLSVNDTFGARRYTSCPLTQPSLQSGRSATVSYERVKVPRIDSPSWHTTPFRHDTVSQARCVHSRAKQHNRNSLSRRARYTSSMWGIVKKVVNKQVSRSQLQQLFQLWQEYQRIYDRPTPTVYSAVIVGYQLMQCHTLTVQLYHRFRQRYEQDQEVSDDGNTTQAEEDVGAQTPQSEVSSLSANSTEERRATLQKIAYDMVLRSAQKLGDIDTFMSVLSDLEQQGMEITRSHYESLLATCLTAGEEDKANKVLEQLEELPGDASPRLYRVMAKHRMEHKEYDRAVLCIEELHQKESLDRSRDSFMCEQLATAALNGHDFRTARKCFDLMRSMNATFDLGTLQWLLYNSSSRGFLPVASAAFEMLTSHRTGHGIQPQEHHFAALIQSCVVCHDWKRAFELLTVMSREGVVPARSTVEMVVRDLSILLGIYLRSEHMGTYLLTLVSDQTLKIESISTANVILLALARSAVPQLVEEAVSLVFGGDLSRGNGVTLEPNQLTYEILLEAYSSSRCPNVEACENVIKTMKQAQLEITSISYDFLISSYLYSEMLEEAMETLQSSVAEGKHASRTTFEQVGKTAARHHEENKVNEVLRLMEVAEHPYTRRFLGYLRRQREGTHADYQKDPFQQNGNVRRMNTVCK
eukprot:gb/GECG01004689.1/.p1 GENE.gb/GECG01004689.1/~~gb/GECG01004689.1/.p1  ORF type:complete len:682 (+),score=71.79 gb/GECG01004689.1/:1-2046(+)